MMNTEIFELRFDGAVEKGTAELYHWLEYGQPLRVLYFHSQYDYERWTKGASFRLVNHWTKPAPPPRYR